MAPKPPDSSCWPLPLGWAEEGSVFWLMLVSSTVPLHWALGPLKRTKGIMNTTTALQTQPQAGRGLVWPSVDYQGLRFPWSGWGALGQVLYSRSDRTCAPRPIRQSWRDSVTAMSPD